MEDIDIKAIKSSLKELETERDDIQLKCIKAELELSIENILNRLEQLEKDYGELERKYIWGNLMYDRVLKENEFWKAYKEKLDKLDTEDFIFKHELENYIPKSVIREYKDKFIEDSKNETVFMTQSTQINASLISFCNELLGGSNE